MKSNTQDSEPRNLLILRKILNSTLRFSIKRNLFSFVVYILYMYYLDLYSIRLPGFLPATDRFLFTLGRSDKI